MTTTEVQHQINRFRLWASQCENLASIPRVSDHTEIKGRALADAYRHCADALEGRNTQSAIGNTNRVIFDASPISNQTNSGEIQISETIKYTNNRS